MISNELVDIRKLASEFIKMQTYKKLLVKEKNMIWVLGENQTFQKLWIQALIEIDINPENIKEVIFS